MIYIHCDKCGKEAPPLEEAQDTGWYLSLAKSVSGIPMEFLCPDCLRENITPTLNKQV
jgi:hypothetical protein